MLTAVYHGKTGIVYNVSQRGVGVICYKVVNGRYVEKRVNVRVEHVKHSKCRQEFLDRVKSNAAKKREAKEKGEHVNLKRQPVQPREARVVSIKNNAPQTLTAQPCECTERGTITTELIRRRDHDLSQGDLDGWIGRWFCTTMRMDGMPMRKMLVHGLRGEKICPSSRAVEGSDCDEENVARPAGPL